MHAKPRRGAPHINTLFVGGLHEQTRIATTSGNPITYSWNPTNGNPSKAPSRTSSGQSLQGREG